MNRYLIKATTVKAVRVLLFDSDTAVIAGTTQQLTDISHHSPTTLGLAAPVIGALGSGMLGQKMRGREARGIMAILFTLSATELAFPLNGDALNPLVSIKSKVMHFGFVVSVTLLQFRAVFLFFPITEASPWNPCRPASKSHRASARI